ncbi:sodium transporter [bacterium (Candidatus Blackallbacteria) CG17_big_fil_post_rev_8_21_14_2_50_48_46]|uniref:Sodium transporter n=1 Tax=bacterium (Candidatus Blackallbacteria) CG17_big_fil_post_rev_8_21_14_2_50_48_46 TaxID=2014261 RepID=A0A2M7FX68_9BACT|nr:MAG: sodium transporter [bacterium (Candidatus Blackallbacteria) CG18_big_fil_WC_8_21_14_2_50_49_26]PIW13814.1 MAG: sodium transporter [bacterium (Candidatus Blackallbacteria) CG17_big_fil_post_rev_8_21_14_2_50_48_46]PIW45040.1 MAG: sodium transporter [bacterium (Candidatus Blackallbacteria) CG13_big_fil_rev_8_21_14_2_50_49_14]
MQTLDLIVIVLYFAGVAAIGYFSSRKSLTDSKSYFLGGSGVGWMAIGASLFASNISAEHFIGLAGSGAAGGLAVGQFEWLACLILILLGWLFVPFYLRTGVFTMPEFLELRFNRQCRTYLSAISLIAYVFTKVSVAVYAGALVLKTILGWDIWLGAIVLIVATGAYTVFGGLRAVIYTDFFQAFVLIGGGLFLTVAAISQVGGPSVLFQKLPLGFFNLWKGVSHPDFPWTGILFGAPILGIWYWCTDQMIVQRTLAAKNISEAQKATLTAGFLKLLPVFILVLPGMAGHVLYPQVKPDEIYVTLVHNLLPTGIKGLVVAGLLAALMSSLSSVFNSSSTLVVMDFYHHWRPQASEKELVRAGQASTLVLVGVGLLWLPLIGLMSNQLYLYLQSVQAYISPPIAAVFLAGLLWKRANGQGAFAALLTGFVLGSLRFVAEILLKLQKISPESFLGAYASINFLHFAILLFVVAGSVLALVSLLTLPPTASQLQIFASTEGPTETNKKAPNAAALFLILIVLAMWFLLSPLMGFKG